MKLLYLVRLDSAIRHEGLVEVLRRHIDAGRGSALKIWEVDEAPQFGFMEWCAARQLQYCFTADSDPAFHRTAWSNRMVLRTPEQVIAICHADVYVPDAQVAEAARAIERGEKYVAAFGDETDQWGLMRANEKYLRHMQADGDPAAILTDDTLLDFPFKRRLGSYSGMVFLDREFYVAAGMDNEKIIGWGPEEVERHIRLTRLGSGYRRIAGWCAHMPHDGAYSQVEQRERNSREFQRIHCITREMMLQEVARWKEYRGY